MDATPAFSVQIFSRRASSTHEYLCLSDGNGSRENARAREHLRDRRIGTRIPTSIHGATRCNVPPRLLTFIARLYLDWCIPDVFTGRIASAFARTRLRARIVDLYGSKTVRSHFVCVPKRRVATSLGSPYQFDRSCLRAGCELAGCERAAILRTSRNGQRYEHSQSIRTGMLPSCFPLVINPSERAVDKKTMLQPFRIRDVTASRSHSRGRSSKNESTPSSIARFNLVLQIENWLLSISFTAFNSWVIK